MVSILHSIWLHMAAILKFHLVTYGSHTRFHLVSYGSHTAFHLVTYGPKTPLHLVTFGFHTAFSALLLVTYGSYTAFHLVMIPILHFIWLQMIRILHCWSYCSHSHTALHLGTYGSHTAFHLVIYGSHSASHLVTRGSSNLDPTMVHHSVKHLCSVIM